MQLRQENTPEGGGAKHGPVLFLLNSLTMGGSERKTVRLVNALHKRGWDVRLAYLDADRRTPPALREEVAAGVSLLCLGRRGRYSPAALWRLCQYLRRERPSSLFCVNLHPLVYAVPALWCSRRANRPRLLALVNTTGVRSRREARFMRLYRRLLCLPDRLVFGCRHQMLKWLTSYGLPRDKAMWIYNGTDLSKFLPDPERPRHAAVGGLAEPVGQTLRLCCVAQLRPEKNQGELISAVRALVAEGTPVRLRLVGDGPEYPRLQRLVRDLGLDPHVEFVGQRGDVRPDLAWADVFVLTSRVETFSNAALEAMAMARPVVLSRVGGAEEMVTAGQDGFTYRAGAVDELVEVLRRLAAGRAELARLGENARATVERRFSFQRMVGDFEDLLARETPGVASRPKDDRQPRSALPAGEPGRTS